MAEKFEYKYESYSIKEKEEVENIRRQYLPKQKEDNKLARLKKLDKLVNTFPTIFALSLGVIGILLFGTGLTFFLQWKNFFYFGIPFVLIGSIIMIVVYPLYIKIYNYLKEKYTNEILQLSDEILKNDN